MELDFDQMEDGPGNLDHLYGRQGMRSIAAQIQYCTLDSSGSDWS